MRWFLALGMAGCTGQSGTEVDTPACAEQVDERSISAEDVIDGQTASALAADAMGRHEAELTFYDIPSSSRRMVRSELTIEADLTRARELRWRTKGFPEQICAPTIDVPARILLTTDDGTLAGTFAGTLTGSRDQLTVFAFQRRASLGGTYDSNWFAENPNVAVRVWMSRAPSKVTSISISMDDDGRTSAEVADL